MRAASRVGCQYEYLLVHVHARADFTGLHKPVQAESV